MATLTTRPQTSQAEVFQTMRAATSSLAALFEDLHRQTVQVSEEGSPEVALELSKLYKKMNEQDEIHREGVTEIQSIVEECIESSLFEELKMLGRLFVRLACSCFADRHTAQKEIDDSIDRLVEEQLAFCLQDLLPDRIQGELDENTRLLEEMRVELQNSESRRKNATSRWQNAEEHLEPIYLIDGTISKDFPKTLQELFSLDDKTCKSLMREYDMPDVSESSEYNLNRFIQFCGVACRWRM